MDFFNTLFAQYHGVEPALIVLESIASLFGVASVLLVRRGSVWAFPVGIVSTAGFVWLLWVYALFGDMLINAYYTVLSVYGWANWAHQRQQEAEFSVSPFDRNDARASLLLAAFSTAFVGTVYWFKPFINNGFDWGGATPGFAHFTWMDYTDIFTTALFLVAMWLMARRKIAHWILWIIADAVSVPLYYHKGLLFSAVQYFIFTLIAVSGYYAWNARLAKPIRPASSALP